MAPETLNQINDAIDATADAKAMVWAVFHMAQGMHQDELSDAISACCNQAIVRLSQGSKDLEEISTTERRRMGL